MTEPQKGRYANFQGSKPALDEPKQKQICGIVAQGMTLTSAADLVGLGRSTVYRAAKKNAEFGEALRQARSRGEFKLVRIVHEASSKTRDGWRAAAWLLTHCYRDHYRTRQPDGIPPEQVRVIFERFTDALLSEVQSPEDRRRILARIQKIGGEIAGAADVDRQLGNEA